MNTRGVRIAVFAILMAASGVWAEDRLGIGVILGEPTGISVKKWISEKHAIDAAVAWSFAENDSFQFHVDYLIHRFGVLKTGTRGDRLPLYFGIGGRLKLRDDNNDETGRNNDDVLIGIRVPLGISYFIAESPLELFGEIVPVLDMVPDTDFDINGAIGLRFYF